MKYLHDHPWLTIITAEIAADKLAAPVADSHPNWEYIDSQILKLGTLSHQQLDIKEIQQQALSLLESETKDMRVLSHLLRTLQHNGNSAELFLAFVLFSHYIQLYWQTAYPPVKLKARLALQIIKRFNNEKLLNNDSVK